MSRADSDNAEVAPRNIEDRYLKLQVQGAAQVHEFPLSEDGSLSLSDLHMILPGVVALIAETASIKRLLKPKNGYFYEPKEGWENVWVSVAAAMNSQINNVSAIREIYTVPSTSCDDSSSVFGSALSSQTTTFSSTPERASSAIKTKIQLPPEEVEPPPSRLQPPEGSLPSAPSQQDSIAVMNHQLNNVSAIHNNAPIPSTSYDDGVSTTALLAVKQEEAFSAIKTESPSSSHSDDDSSSSRFHTPETGFSPASSQQDSVAAMNQQINNVSAIHNNASVPSPSDDDSSSFFHFGVSSSTTTFSAAPTEASLAIRTEIQPSPEVEPSRLQQPETSLPRALSQQADVAAMNNQINNVSSIHSASVPSTDNSSSFFHFGVSPRATSFSTTPKEEAIQTEISPENEPSSSLQSPETSLLPAPSQQQNSNGAIETESDVPSTSTTESQDVEQSLQPSAPSSLRPFLSSSWPQRNFFRTFRAPTLDNIFGLVLPKADNLPPTTSTTISQQIRERPNPPSLRSNLSSALPQQKHYDFSVPAIHNPFRLPDANIPSTSASESQTNRERPHSSFLRPSSSTTFFPQQNTFGTFSAPSFHNPFRMQQAAAKSITNDIASATIGPQEDREPPPSFPSSSLQQQNSPKTVNVKMEPQSPINDDVAPETQDVEDGEILSTSPNHSNVHHLPVQVIMPHNEPSWSDIFAAYNVFSKHDLKEVLCRGVSNYSKSYDMVTKFFKKTMIAYRNNEIVRLLYFAMNSTLLYNQIDPNAPKYCELCNHPFKLYHLMSEKHITLYKATYNKEPPEILTLLDPRYYLCYIDAESLVRLQLHAYKRMEESPQFTKRTHPDAAFFFRIKYQLIHRILEANLKLSNVETFYVDKIFFLLTNTHHPCLRDVFNNILIPYNCGGCGKRCQNLDSALRHIFTKQHLMRLKQGLLNKISIALSMIKETANGYIFDPQYVITPMGKRHLAPPPAAINPKRQKK